MLKTLLPRLANWSLLLCSFRPLFLATVLLAAVGVALWLGFLGFGIPLPGVPGGPLVWHAHEMLLGFGLAAVAGFVLTAVPEFTSTAAFGRQVGFGFLLLWLAARLSFWLSGVIGPWPAALFNSAFAIALVVLLAPRLLGDPLRRQYGFFGGLGALALVTVGFHVDAVAGQYPMRWLYAGIGVMMVLIVVAMSRISMRILNDAIQARRDAGHEVDEDYRARAPRRNLAIFCISLFTLAEWLALPAPLNGWLALAAAAAMFNLLNDWHIGRALLERWSLMLYSVYWLMALGYGALGVSLLADGFASSAGRHLLTLGAMGVSILAVLCIAGRTHSGYALDQRRWVPIAACLLVLAALLRALAGLPGAPVPLLNMLAGLGWLTAFALSMGYLAPIWLKGRPDGGQGCDEPVGADAGGGCRV
ncbi:NnrS family protein [Pseudomonas kunmingensis]|uniref:NnrS family protein n=1 Tax=Stutzerimonas stutzeri subgroup TaxID=578833 RepID=UPI0002549B10|nr:MULTISPECIES: NnrS family protein [Stutzerimonas stutzeri subgroup]EHY77348.1 NnrS family protein [Stutzerimonas stutzeri ATCC 14405 = CCUG 16156]MBA1239623.1 NnrS family protein [Stutzerimonas kunmingensis]MDH2243142.1 NnrS family protein [Pseudomonas sp. GD03909]QOZ93924.1 NnrS family protein [Stutzerimonas stutzeri]